MAKRAAVDAVIIGAGPAGLFAAFQLGIHGMRCRILDSDSQFGGQCVNLYADKPVFDMPGHPSIEARALIGTLKEQIARFKPQIALRECVVAIRLLEDGSFDVGTDSGQSHVSRHVVIATGLGHFGVNGRLAGIKMPDGLGAGSAFEVDTATFQTAVPNLFAIGDAASYPGKLPLLVSAFHEAALMAFAVRKQRAGGKRIPMEYSSTSSAMKTLFTDQ